ncbi:MAG TPA: HlyC/CorC family transporter [Syntrophus sp. (in: bacteria)]|nr:HlyC/CorC family transporter [Syntrophus sp. (in: bacteria)]
MPIELVLIIALFFLSAGFSASETALTALTPTALERLVERGGKRGLALWQRHPLRILITILVGNNAANMAAAALATLLAEERFRNFGVAVGVGILTLALILFGEIVPKSLAKKHSVTAAPWAIAFLRFFYYPLLPVTLVLHRFVQLFAFGAEEGFEERDLIYAIRLSSRKGIVPGDRARMMLSIVQLENLRAREIMVPRTKALYRDLDTPREELARAFQESGHSRMPVFRGREDNIVGILHAKDLLRFAVPVPSLLKPPLFIPDGKRAPQILRDMQRLHQHLAVVVDEFGAFAGIVTLEDILEEIVGEIQDEFDNETPGVRRVGPDEVVFAGGTGLATVSRALETVFPVAVHYETLGGFLTDRLGRVGRNGDRVEEQGWGFEVVDADPRQIIRVRARRLPTGRGTPP